MNYLKQIYYEMRHHRMMTWISISGTALAIFLVMSFIMANSINTIETAPESLRSRILVGQNMHVEAVREKNINVSTGSTTGLNQNLAARLYDGIDGVESVSYVSAWDSSVDANLKGSESITLSQRWVDENFWKIYDFTFIDGRPFDEAERKADSPMVVITRSTARRLFGEVNVAGREIEIGMVPFTVVGVVEDVSALLNKSYAQIYGIFNVETEKYQNDWFGNANVRMLLKEGTDASDVKKEVERRYSQLAIELEPQGVKPVYHDQPYTAEDIGAGADGSNNTPATKRQRTIHWFIYLILVLLPAINLSSMTRSRLRHRVAEIGVRRAFGARRSDIVTQLFGENLIITVIGGAIGLILSLLFLLYAYTFLFSTSGFDLSLEVINSRPDFGMLFRWNNFLIAFALCFVLNVLSATVPAWKASLTEPAEALSSR